MKSKKLIILFISILVLNIALLSGCTKQNENALKASDLVGYWVTTSGYTAENQVVDTVIHFIDENELAVYSYFDGGKGVYNYKVQKSTDETITILIDDEINKPTEIKFVSEDNIEYSSTSGEDTINLTRIDEKEAESFIEILEEYAEY